MSTENSNYDDQVWEMLLENRSNWTGYDEVEDTVWPANRKEIRATRKVLNGIDPQSIGEEEVRAEYDLQRNLIEATESELPNNRLKMIVPLVMLIAAIAFYVWYAFPPQQSYFDPEDWVVAVPSEFVSTDARKPKFDLLQKTIPKGVQVTPLAEGQQRLVKVQLPSGETGYMHPAAFSGVERKGEIVKGTPLYSVRDKTKKLSTIEENLPRIIATPNISGEDKHYLKVKTSKGRIGYIIDNHIKYHFDDSLLEINESSVKPVASTRALNWKGQTIAEVEKRYGPATSVFENQANWENVRIIGDTSAYKGVAVYVGAEGKVDSVLFGQSERLWGAMSFFPVWRMIASLEPFYGVADGYYEREERSLNIGWWQDLRSGHWTVRAITWVIQAILKIVWFLMQISVPFIPVMIIGVFISHLERPSYRLSMNVVLWLTLLVFVVIAVAMNLQGSVGWFELILIIGLFLVGAAINLSGFFGHLNRKCTSCGNWDGEITEATDFMGKSISVKYGSRDKYLGSDTRQTASYDSISTNTKTRVYTTTHRYERIKTKATYQYDNYKDHKMCKYCGMRWEVSYKVLRGERHEDL